MIIMQTHFLLLRFQTTTQLTCFNTCNILCCRIEEVFVTYINVTNCFSLTTFFIPPPPGVLESRDWQDQVHRAKPTSACQAAISFVHLGHISSLIHELLNCMSPSIANLCLIKQRANRSAEYQGSCMSNTALAMGNRESISPFLSELTFVSMAALFSHTTQSRKRSKDVKPAMHIASCL